MAELSDIGRIEHRSQTGTCPDLSRLRTLKGNAGVRPRARADARWQGGGHRTDAVPLSCILPLLLRPGPAGYTVDGVACVTLLLIWISDKICARRSRGVTMAYQCGNRECVGMYCHFCGDYVGHRSGLRTGKHLFCDNKDKCKMAHHRAVNRYSPRVTARIHVDDQASAPSRPGGNQRKRAVDATSSPAIVNRRRRRGNSGKGAK